MGRECRRVPLDFAWPLDKIWSGYLVPPECKTIECKECETPNEDDRGWDCKNCGGNWELAVYPDGTPWKETKPPTGEGYQLWETTTEGSPQSPVFKTIEELAQWCAEHATVFGNSRASAEEWLAMLTKDFVALRRGPFMFI